MLSFIRSTVFDFFTVILILSFVLLKTIPQGGTDDLYVGPIKLTDFYTVFYICIGTRIVYALNRWLTIRWTNNFVRDPTWNWPNEIAVVTGGSSGIGAEIVRELTRHRIKTIILDINPPSAKLGDGVAYYQLNLTSSTSISSVAAKIKQDHGNPSILINNAGTGTAHTILSEAESERRRVYEVNTLCHFTLVREFLPWMIEKDHGHVMTIASTGSFYSQAQNVSYACSKASAMAFHEGLSQELRLRFNAPRVRTSIIFPDFVRTPLVQALTSKVEKFPVEVLEPDVVAKEAVRALLSTYGHNIVLPRKMAFLALLRGLPLLQRIVQKWDPDPLALVNL